MPLHGQLTSSGFMDVATANKLELGPESPFKEDKIKAELSRFFEFTEVSLKPSLYKVRWYNM